MSNFDIYTDSTSDMSKELRDRYNVFYTPMYVIVDGEEKIADLDWKEFSAQQFYNWMREGAKTSTAQVIHSTFIDMFSKSLEAGKDVLFLSVSTGLSGTYNASLLAAEELMEKYPGRKIICVDTLRANVGEALIVMKASDLRKEGLSIEEVADWLNENKLKFHEVAAVESLTYLKNAGRVKATSAFFGNLFGVKPMVIADANGNNYAVKKVKGRRASLLEIINMTRASIIEPENQIVLIEHADSEIDCEFVKQHIIDEFNPKEVIVLNVGPIIGSTVGPGTIVVGFYGQEVTVKGE